MKTKLLVILALGLLWNGATLGNGLQVAPTSLTIGTRDSATELWLKKTAQGTNTAPMNAQIRIFRWTQVAGEDRLLPTSDLLVSPPFVRLAGDQNQLVRVIRNPSGPLALAAGDVSPVDEQAYRLIVDEIPSADAAGRGVQFVMHYSIPVFIHPLNQPAAGVTDGKVNNGFAVPRLTWSWKVQGGVTWIQAENLDVIHAQVVAVTFKDAQGGDHSLEKGLMGYVLPHSIMRWKVALPPALTQRAGTITATINGHEAITLPIP